METLTFYRISKKGDKEIKTAFTETPERIQYFRQREQKEIREAKARLFMRANSKVKGNDRVQFDNETKTFLRYYRCRFNGGELSHIEIDI